MKNFDTLFSLSSFTNSDLWKLKTTMKIFTLRVGISFLIYLFNICFAKWMSHMSIWEYLLIFVRALNWGSLAWILVVECLECSYLFDTFTCSFCWFSKCCWSKKVLHSLCKKVLWNHYKISNQRADNNQESLSGKYFQPFFIPNIETSSKIISLW